MTLTLHAACRNFVGLVIVRGFLGGFEAVCQPAFLLLTSMWYKREEQATTAILWSVVMRSVCSGRDPKGTQRRPKADPKLTLSGT